MILSFHPVVSQLLLFLALLCPPPVSPTVPPPTVDGPELESALLHLQAALEEPADPRGEEQVLRRQRGALTDRLLSPFPGGHLMESVSYQDGGEGSEGGKRNEALTSIAGGLQAANREKGGFGFRFGRKRWSDRGSGTDEGRFQ